jgi:hypothetical protein
MAITEKDCGRVLRKRDNPMRRFKILAVEGENVTLEDQITHQVFALSDLRTYEFSKPAED